MAAPGWICRAGTEGQIPIRDEANGSWSEHQILGGASEGHLRHDGPLVKKTTHLFGK